MGAWAFCHSLAPCWGLLRCLSSSWAACAANPWGLCPAGEQAVATSCPGTAWEAARGSVFGWLPACLLAGALCACVFLCSKLHLPLLLQECCHRHRRL